MSPLPKSLPTGVGVALVLAFSLMVGPSCSTTVAPEVSADDPQLVLGRNTWISSCARCHSQDGSGGSGPKLQGGLAVEKFSDAEAQKELVRTGRLNKGMPAFGAIFTEEQVDAVVRYTREVL